MNRLKIHIANISKGPIGLFGHYRDPGDSMILLCASQEIESLVRLATEKFISLSQPCETVDEHEHVIQKFQPSLAGIKEALKSLHTAVEAVVPIRVPTEPVAVLDKTPEVETVVLPVVEAVVPVVEAVVPVVEATLAPVAENGKTEEQGNSKPWKKGKKSEKNQEA
jgi:hypothetical protein